MLLWRGKDWFLLAARELWLLSFCLILHPVEVEIFPIEVERRNDGDFRLLVLLLLLAMAACFFSQSSLFLVILVEFSVVSSSTTMADADLDVDVAAAQPKKRTFKKFTFRGVDLDALLDMSSDDLVKLFHARARRRFQRGLKRKPMALIKKLRKAKREALPGEKPEPVKTHLRNMIIMPEMIGSIIGVYNGKTFNQVEIKPEMIGHYLAEFSISYKPVKHGRPGIGATHSSRFIPLK
ncbi:hypothetical protein SUGI_0985050 [Cryptomeria japonica]|nr:hypothetical protein SUGI_0985050 [Cryptomeria japonica]